jgi:hypothetical protein
VTFEIMELEKVKKNKGCANCYWKGSRRFCWWKWCYGSIWTAETGSVVEVEEIKVVTKLTMASRKLKIKISNELLMERKCRLTLSWIRLVVCLVKATSVQNCHGNADCIFSMSICFYGFHVPRHHTIMFWIKYKFI